MPDYFVGIAFSDAGAVVKHNSHDLIYNLPDLVLEFSRPLSVIKLCDQGKHNKASYLARDVPLDWPGMKGVELQPEAPYMINGSRNMYSWKNLNYDEAVPGFIGFISNCKAVYVHIPTTNGIIGYQREWQKAIGVYNPDHGRRDLSSLGIGHREWSVAETLECMEFAGSSIINADGLIVHAGQTDCSDEDKQTENFIRSFETMMDCYSRDRHTYVILLENLEGKKLGRSIEQIRDKLLPKCRRVAGEYGTDPGKIGICYDINHDWHQNPGNGFIDRFRNVVRGNYEDIILYHLARLSGNNSHAPIDNLNDIEKSMLDMIKSDDKYMKNITMEIFNDHAKKIRQSVKCVREYTKFS